MARALGSKYELDEVLGRGATGEVWRGRAHEGGEFAFKILHDTLTRDPETVRRFLQEGAILTRIDHPNIVRVHDLVAEGDTLAIVMDLVPGHDLRRTLVERRVLPPSEACAIAAETANGLAAIHTAGVVHRDVKPENVLLDERTTPPSVRLTDFGIARIAEQTGSRSTMLVGTPPYVAPELADGQSATPATDLYSLGIMLYELCCGVTPFADKSTLVMLQRHGHHAPGRPQGVPDPLWDLIAALMTKDPGRRPAPAGRVAMLLAAMVQDLAQVPPAPALTEPPPSVPLVHGQPTQSRMPPGAVGRGPEGQRPEGSGPEPGRGPQPAPGHGPGAPLPMPGAPPSRRRRGRGRTISIMVGALLLVGVLGTAGYAIMRPGDSSDPRSNPQPNPSNNQGGLVGTDAPAAAPSSARATYGPKQVPDLKGLPESQARALLPRTVAVQVVRQLAPAGTPDGVVLAQDPQPGADLPSTLELTVASQQATQYLADLVPTSGEMVVGSEAADYKLSGHAQLHALGDVGSPCGDEIGHTEYDLGQHYTKLLGLAGVDDNSPAAKTQVTFEVFGDSRKLTSITVRLGKSKPLDINVSGVLRLTLRWTFSGGDASRCEGGTLVLGDAQLVAAAGYVPPSTAEPSAQESPAGE